MTITKNVICVELRGEKFPVIEIIESLGKGEKLQIVIRYIHQDAHLTLHEKDPDILFTMYDNKYSSTWSETKIEIAQKLGYENPEKHGHYLFHRLISREKDGLGARQVNLKKHKGDSKYLKKALLIGGSLIESPMVEITLYAVNHAQKPSGDFIGTGLGELYFKIIEK